MHRFGSIIPHETMYLLLAIVSSISASPVQFIGDVAVTQLKVGYPNGDPITFILLGRNQSHIVPEITNGPNVTTSKVLPIYGWGQREYVELQFLLGDSAYGLLSLPRLNNYCLLLDYYGRNEFLLGTPCSDALTHGRLDKEATTRLNDAYLIGEPLLQAVGTITNAKDGTHGAYTFKASASSVANFFVCYFAVTFFGESHTLCVSYFVTHSPPPFVDH